MEVKCDNGTEAELERSVASIVFGVYAEGHLLQVWIRQSDGTNKARSIWLKK